MDARGVIERLLQAGSGDPARPVRPAAPSAPETTDERDEPSSPAEAETEAAPAEPPAAAVAAPVPAAPSAQDAGAPHEPPEPEPLRRLEASAAVAESLGLGFHLGSAVERLAAGAAAGTEGLESLREAVWLIERYVELVEERPEAADLHQASVRIAGLGEAIAQMRALSAALADERAARSEAPSVLAPASAPVARPAAEPSPSSDHVSLVRELSVSAARWAFLVATVVLIVLGLTLIGDWRG